MLDLFNVLECTVGEATIPPTIITIIKSVYTLIQIGIPIILVIMGMMDLGKAVASQKEDEIKKAQSMLIKRVIYGVLVFLVFTIVDFALGVIGGSETAGARGCLSTIFGNGG